MIRAEIQRELKKLAYEEKRILKKNGRKKDSFVTKKIEEKMPDKLEDTLNAAFAKAFELIFNYGTDAISLAVSDDGKNKLSNSMETAATFMEGAVMGLLGIGIPDIAVFTGVVLRSIYQIADECGFDYESKAEKVYILLLIECSLAKGEDALELNDELDKLSNSIDNEGEKVYGLITEYINKSAEALAGDMLYMKFIQGLPVIGAAGGVSNAVTLKKIRSFAEIKYRKRKLSNML